MNNSIQKRGTSGYESWGESMKREITEGQKKVQL